MSHTERRYDIDWLRVIAIGLLLIYHVAIGFQPWGIMIGFISNENSWEPLWVPMSMLNIWRIPLLFFVSGMGIYFALKKRNLRQLILERSSRILLPFLFGSLFIVPIHLYIWQRNYGLDTVYGPNPGHLWFLGNIFVYVLLLSPFFVYLKANDKGKVARIIKEIFSTPLGLIFIKAAFVIEVVWVSPKPYELYAMTWHGFFLGFLAFLFGFCMILAGQPFWQMIQKWRGRFLLIAMVFFGIRLVVFQQSVPGYLLAIESSYWIFSVLGFGSRYLNRPGRILSYLSHAAYPVYIVHMIFLYLGSMLIFPHNLTVPVQFILVLFFTLSGSLLIYEIFIRRISYIKPFFGLKGRISETKKCKLTYSKSLIKRIS